MEVVLVLLQVNCGRKQLAQDTSTFDCAGYADTFTFDQVQNRQLLQNDLQIFNSNFYVDKSSGLGEMGVM